jgi:hypothetical protein
MTSEKVEFIHILDAYVSIDSIAFIIVKKAGITVHLKGNDRTFSVRSPCPPEVDDFLAKYTVLDIRGEPPAGGAIAASIL